MKNFYLSVMLAPMLILSACGKSDDKNGVIATAAIATSCSEGQVLSSQYGCLQPYQGQTGYGLYNNTAVAASCWSGTVMGYYGCTAQGSMQQPGYPGQNPGYNGGLPMAPPGGQQGQWVWINGYGWWFRTGY